MNRFLITVLTAFILAPSLALAQSGNRGGGNFTGLSATAIMKLVPGILSQYGPNLVTEAQLESIEQITASKETVVAISPNPIPVQISGILQNSSAYTSGKNHSAVILIYQGDWDDHSSSLSEKLAFMTHEVCVALGIEKTGKYGKVSANLLNNLIAANYGVQKPNPVLEYADAQELAKILEDAGIVPLKAQSHNYILGFGLTCEGSLASPRCYVSTQNADPAATRSMIYGTQAITLWNLLVKAGFIVSISQLSDGTSGKSIIQAADAQCKIDLSGPQFYSFCKLQMSQ